MEYFLMKKNLNTLLKENGLALSLAPENFKTERVVYHAVKQNGMALQYAGASLQGNRRIVFQAVSQNGMALQFAKKELQNEKIIVEKSIEKSRIPLQFSDLKKDKGFIMEISKKYNDFLDYVDEDLKIHTFEQIMRNVDFDFTSFQSKLYENYDFVKKIAIYNPNICQKIDKLFILKLAKDLGHIFPISNLDHLKNDSEFLLNYLSITQKSPNTILVNDEKVDIMKEKISEDNTSPNEEFKRKEKLTQDDYEWIISDEEESDEEESDEEKESDKEKESDEEESDEDDQEE